MSIEQEILVTGIKVVDLLAPYAKGGKIGMEHSLFPLDGCSNKCTVHIQHSTALPTQVMLGYREGGDPGMT